MKKVLTNEQVTHLVSILTQYAPDGWKTLNMHLLTDESHTEVTTWATTDENPKHGFHLDNDDRSSLDEMVDIAWGSSGRAWNQIDFSVTADGEFVINAN
jgi:hypothetical protein